ncbi:MAG: hypothetical protein NWF00_02345 [Candidatus Bathyarchaeota archaeon]|nr:hypothetical protein [Candidatus Bathyarchaeota archaeon]
METEGLNVFPQQSKKLQELCTCLTAEKVSFYFSKNNWQRNSRYQYYIICSQYTQPYNFPVFLNPPISMVTEQTTIYDEETRERVDIPLKAQVMIRIKGSRVGSAIQALVQEGHVEVSDIRQVQIAALVPELSVITLICYLDPEDIRQSLKPTEK